MRVLRKNAHVDLATGRRTDQWVGDGQVVDVYWEPLTASQLTTVREFERTMKEETIPEIERVMRMRARRAQKKSKLDNRLIPNGVGSYVYSSQMKGNA